MRKLLYLFIIVLLSSCLEDGDNYIRTTDLVPITEVTIPDSSEVADTIQITATAEANNDCWSDLRFQLDSVPNQNNNQTDTTSTKSYSLQAIGTYESHGSCPQVIVTADTVLDVLTSQKGNYIFYVTKNSYTLEVDTVFVE